MSSDDSTLSLNDHELLLQLVTMFRGFDGRLQSFDERLQRIESRLDSIESRLQEHEARLESLEKTVEARLYDTRPIWEAVQLQITDLQLQITDLQLQITELRTDVQLQITELRADVEKGFRRSDRKVTLFVEQVSELYAYQRDLEERIEKLEPKA